MYTLSMRDIESLTSGRWIVPPGDGRPVVSLTSDSRTVTPNSAFAAIDGDNVDGHDYVVQAVRKGARLLIVERDVADDIHKALQTIQHTQDMPGMVLVDRTIDALCALAQAHRNQLTVPVVAVVGANGKTTTKGVIAKAVGSFCTVYAAPKSFNNDLGVPLTLLNARQNHDAVICEIGTNDPGETGPLAKIVKPNILVVTGAGREHLEGLGSAQGSANEIKSCLEHMHPGGLIITNADELLTRDCAHPKCDTICAGFDRSADVHVTLTDQSLAGTQAQIRSMDEQFGSIEISLHMIGQHTARAAAMAIIAAQHIAATQKTNPHTIIPSIISALGSLWPQPMRLEVSTHTILGTDAHPTADSITVINDAYNANPDSMQVALTTLARVAPTSARLVLVLGDMRETGSHAQRVHAELADRILALARTRRKPVIAILVGTSVRWTRNRLNEKAKDARNLTTKVFSEDTACSQSTADEITKMVQSGDVFLLKGSRSMQLELVSQTIKAELMRPTEPEHTKHTHTE